MTSLFLGISGSGHSKYASDQIKEPTHLASLILDSGWERRARVRRCEKHKIWGKGVGHGGDGENDDDEQHIQEINQQFNQALQHKHSSSKTHIIFDRFCKTQEEEEQEEEPVRSGTVSPQLGSRLSDGQDPLDQCLLSDHQNQSLQRWETWKGLGDCSQGWCTDCRCS